MAPTSSDLRARNYVLAPIHLEHVQHCPASRVYTYKRPRPTFAQWHGIAVHLFLEKMQKVGREGALEYIARKFPSKLKFCQRIETNKIPKGDPEVQYLLDLERGPTPTLQATCPGSEHRSLGRRL